MGKSSVCYFQGVQYDTRKEAKEAQADHRRRVRALERIDTMLNKACDRPPPKHKINYFGLDNFLEAMIHVRAVLANLVALGDEIYG